MAEKPALSILVDPGSVAETAAALLIRAAREAIESRGVFNLLLSGGSTPKMMYTALARTDYRLQLDWRKVRFFWGDERCVPPDHPDSNYNLVWHCLLSHLGSTLDVHRIRGEMVAWEAAAGYENDLRSAFGLESGLNQPPPVFDFVLLGMGEDGHTASLFPGSQALAEHDRWVTWVEHSEPPPPLVSRVTVTLPLINAAQRVVFLVTGASKALQVARIHSSERAASLPAAQVMPTRGELIWLLDEAAAKDLGPAQVRKGRLVA
jgi:6-phosphogluconolactonase